MVHCVGLYCKNNSSRLNGQNITFHKFPKKEDLRAAWVNFVDRLNWQPTESSRLCSAHFKDDDFKENKSNRTLHKGSIPTVTATRVNNKHNTIKVPYACRVPDPEELQNCQEIVIEVLPEQGTGDNNEKLDKLDFPTPTTPLDVVLDSSGQLVVVPTSNESLNSTKTSSQQKYQTILKTSPSLSRNLSSFSTSDETQNCSMKKYKLVENKSVKENEKIKSLRKRLRYYQQTTRRLKVKLQKKDSIIKEMVKKSEGLLHEKTMLNRVGFTKYIVERQLDHLKRKENSKKEYNNELRTFCLELYAISHKAFNYIREKFDNCLPGIKTVQRWKRNTKGNDYLDPSDSSGSELQINSVNNIFSMNNETDKSYSISENVSQTSLFSSNVDKSNKNKKRISSISKNYSNRMKEKVFKANFKNDLQNSMNKKLNADDKKLSKIPVDHTNKSAKIIVESGSIVRDLTNGKYHFEITNDNDMEVYEIVDVPKETVIDSQNL